MKSEVYWIESPWPGKLAILPRPRGGDWLEDEVRAWQQAGVDVVVSLLEKSEAADLDLAQEAEFSRAAGLAYYSFPVVDRGVPASRQATHDLLRSLTHALAEGKNVGIHCRQGIGRSTLIAASLLVLSGITAEAAFEKVGAARGCRVPETSGQREWVQQLANSVALSAQHT